MLAYVTRWFSLWASLPVALAFLKDSSVPVSNSRSPWFGVATSGIVVLSPCWLWVELRVTACLWLRSKACRWVCGEWISNRDGADRRLRCRDTPAAPRLR